MTTDARTPPTRVRAALSKERRIPAERLGISVVRDLVDSIVSGTAKPGETLPPEALLAAEFAVSRTVIRESIKRVEEKGLIQVEQGRGTIVSPTSNWNMLDPDVLDAMIAHDDSLGILDEVVSVRAGLEAEIAAAAATLAQGPRLILEWHCAMLRSRGLDPAAALAPLVAAGYRFTPYEFPALGTVAGAGLAHLPAQDIYRLDFRRDGTSHA